MSRARKLASRHAIGGPVGVPSKLHHRCHGVACYGLRPNPFRNLGIHDFAHPMCARRLPLILLTRIWLISDCPLFCTHGAQSSHVHTIRNHNTTRGPSTTTRGPCTISPGHPCTLSQCGMEADKLGMRYMLPHPSIGNWQAQVCGGHLRMAAHEATFLGIRGVHGSENFLGGDTHLKARWWLTTKIQRCLASLAPPKPLPWKAVLGGQNLSEIRNSFRMRPCNYPQLAHAIQWEGRTVEDTVLAPVSRGGKKLCTVYNPNATAKHYAKIDQSRYGFMGCIGTMQRW